MTHELYFKSPLRVITDPVTGRGWTFREERGFLVVIDGSGGAVLRSPDPPSKDVAYFPRGAYFGFVGERPEPDPLPERKEIRE